KAADRPFAEEFRIILHIVPGLIAGAGPRAAPVISFDANSLADDLKHSGVESLNRYRQVSRFRWVAGLRHRPADRKNFAVFEQNLVRISTRRCGLPPCEGTAHC